MKVWTSLLLVALLCGGAFGVTATWQGDDPATPTLWSDADNWDAALVPTANDTVILTTGTDRCVIDSNAVCKTFIATNYADTLHFAANLTVSGSVTWGARMTITADSVDRKLIVNDTSNLTCAGVDLPCSLVLGGTSTILLADNWDIEGSLENLPGSAVTFGGTAAGKTINVGKNLKVKANYVTAINKPTIVLDGTGTWDGNNYIGGNVSIVSPSVITIGTVRLTTGIFTHTGGTVDCGTGTVSIASSIIGVVDVDFYNLMVINNVVLASNLNVTNTLTNGLTSVDHAIFGYQIDVGNGLSLTGITSGNFVGTTIIRVTGGTISHKAGATGYIVLPIEIAGDVQFGTALLPEVRLARGTANTGSLTFASGTPTFVGSTIKVVASAGAGYYPIAVNDAGNALNALTIEDSVAFSGTKDLSVATFTDTTAGTKITIAAGQEVEVTAGLTLTGTSGSRISLASATPGSLAKLTVNATATQSVNYVNATDIDSRDGARVNFDPYAGTTLSNTFNWYNPAMAPRNVGTCAWGGAGSWGRSQTRWGR